MRRLGGVALFAAALTLTAVSASAQRAKVNGVVSFGLCCSPTGIYVIEPNGTGEKRIYRPPFDDAPLATAWSPNGKRIAYVAPCGLWTMSPSGGARKRITKGTGETGSPTWSPGGRRIAYTDRSSRRAKTYSLFVISAAGGRANRIASGALLSGAAWSSSGLIMFGRGDSLWAVRPNGRGLKKVAEGSSPAWAPDGRRVAFERNGDLWLMNANGSGARLLVAVPSSTAGIAWSPDGNWIAFAIGDRGDIQLIRPDGTGAKPFTHQPGLFHSNPAWQRRP